MNLELSPLSQDVLEIILSLGTPFLVGLLFLGLSAYGGAGVVALLKRFAGQFRPTVDEPTDPLVQLIERLGEALLKRDVDPTVISTLLTTIMDSMKSDGETPKKPITIVVPGLTDEAIPQ